MGTIFIKSLYRNIRRNRTVNLMLFLGLFIAVFCISIMLGFAFGQYETVAGYTSYATLSIIPNEDMLSDINDFPALLEELYGKNLANVLYISRNNKESLLIGWQGTSADRWFPYTAGRFFTEQEQNMGEKVAFVSQNQNLSSIDIDGEVYEVIGSGWIEKYNIKIAISDNVKIDIFSSEAEGNDETYIQIIPYKCFTQNSIPILILIHFDFASTKDLLTYSQILQEKYPNTEIYLPNEDSDEILIYQQIQGIIRALILGLIAGITIIQLAHQWGEFYKKELYVYYLCGMERLKCWFILLGHWAIYFIVASITAIAVHKLCFPFLNIIEADYSPQIIPLVIVLILLFGITSIFSFRGVMSHLYSQGQGEAI